MSTWLLNIILLIMLFLNSCKTPKEPVNVTDKVSLQPSTFPKPVYDFSKNPVTVDGFLLGKALFYDGLLSRDGTIPCGECHRQDFSFSHHLHDLSHGIDNQIGLRNAPSLHNLAWQDSFGWDGGVFSLDLFPVSPIENPVEMDEKMSNVLDKLRKTEKYPLLFEKAFGSKTIDSERFLKALSQFMVSLISANSKYDKVMRKEAGISFTESEEAGFQLFKENCTSCHAGELFTDNSFRNNGLPPTERTQLVTKIIDGQKKQVLEKVIDDGRMRITENPADKNKFKVPNLRNIEATLPYMHDGRFANLTQVLNHYSNTVTSTENLDPVLNKNGKLGIPMSDLEKQQIIAFLKTLTDVEFINNKKFSH
jgi:cytochrome c peroxidase